MIITILLVSGEELIAEFIDHDDRQLRVRRPLRVEYAEMEESLVTRLNRFMSLEDGEETILYMRHVVATSKCAQKVVDYYTKAVDKCYSDSLNTAADPKETALGGITAEEILSLMSGRIKIQ